MAIPTLTACTPTVIFTGGQLVTLTGTNFRLPYPLPTVNGPLPVPPPTVRVTVNGTVAVDVRVLSATSLTCLCGASDPGAAEITVENLDEDGEPIVGETVTESELAAFSRADLTLRSDFTRVTDALILMLRRQVIENVIKTVDTDYASDVGGPVFNIPEIAKLPCIVVSGPKTQKPQYPYVDTPEITTGETFKRRRLTKVVDLVYSVSGYDNHEMRAQNLQALCDQVATLNTSLEVRRDPEDASKGSVRYDLEGGYWQDAAAPNASNVKMFTGEITIRGYQLEDITGFPDQMVREMGESVDTIDLSETAFEPS